MYLYFDSEGYVYGYGSDPEDGSVEVDSVPEEVDQYLGAYFYDEKTGKYTADEDKKAWLDDLMKSEREAESLEQWFTQYDAQVSKLLREQRLGIKSRGATIEELDFDAVKNSQRLEELRTFMATPYNRKDAVIK